MIVSRFLLDVKEQLVMSGVDSTRFVVAPVFCLLGGGDGCCAACASATGKQHYVVLPILYLLLQGEIGVFLAKAPRQPARW